MKRLLVMAATGRGVWSYRSNRERGAPAKPVPRSVIAIATRLQRAKLASFEAFPIRGAGWPRLHAR